MLEWVFRDFVKKLKRSTKNVSRDFVKQNSKEIGYLFDKKIYPLAEKFDYIAKERIKQAIYKTEKLETKIKDDIESLLNNADAKVKDSLQKIDIIRESTIKNVREIIGEADAYLENRINQISFAVMDVLNFTEQNSIIIFKQILFLENKLFQDANQIVDKIDEIIDGKLEMIRNELRKYLTHALPNPFDECRRKLKIGFKPGGMLSDIELYELSECYELSKLKENTLIDEVLKIYGQLQQNAAMMAALVKKSPELKQRVIEDWLKYGLLCEFWRETMKTYV